MAAWIWSQSTYWTLPAMAVWAKAGAAAASTIASIAANNITFLNLIPSSLDFSLGKHSFINLLQRQHQIRHFFTIVNITQKLISLISHARHRVGVRVLAASEGVAAVGAFDLEAELLVERDTHLV